MRKITIIGSLNIDHILKVTNLPLKGETVSSKTLTISEGGKGANQAIAISRLGLGVEIIGKIGRDKYGEMLINNLKKCNVGISGLIVSNLKTGSAFITVDRKGDNLIVIFSGANSELKIRDLRIKEKIIKESDIIILQQEIPKEVVSFSINYAHRLKKICILNYSPVRKIEKKVLNKVDYLIVNEIELSQLIGYPVNQKNAEELIRKTHIFFINNIILTLGSKGSICLTADNRLIRVPSHRVNAIDSTGAGDAFIGGFVYGLSTFKNIKESIIYGNAAGALAVTKFGAQTSFPNIFELNKFIKKQDVKI